MTTARRCDCCSEESTDAMVTLDAGALAALVAVASAKCAAVAEMLSGSAADDATCRYARDLATGTATLLQALPDGVAPGLRDHVDRLHDALETHHERKVA